MGAFVDYHRKYEPFPEEYVEGWKPNDAKWAATHDIDDAGEVVEIDDAEQDARRDALMAEITRRGLASEKFAAEEMTELHKLIATEYLSDYKGDFEFLVSVKQKAWSMNGISAGIAKGVLNCMAADARRAAEKAAEAAAPTPVAPEQPIHEGYYAIEFDGEVVDVRVRQGKGGHFAGVPIVSFKDCGEWDGIGNLDEAGAIRVWRSWKESEKARAVVDALMGGAEAAAKLYIETGRCCVCGRTLTNKDSITAGIGPVCSGKGYGGIF